MFEAPPSLAASPAAALSSAPAPSGPAAAFADRIAQAASVVWDDAHRVTHEALTVERNDAGSAASSAPQAAVTNTFNVNVHVDPDQTGALSDREALEQVLCDLLCDAARRHGLEV